MLRHFEYNEKLTLRPEAVFRVLTDTELWRCSRVYGDIQWTAGVPWQKGSTRTVETMVPFRAQHRQRILEYKENEFISVLSHGMGYTNETQILLAPAMEGGTDLRYLIDIEGKLPLLFGYVIEQFVARFMEVHQAELRRLCQPVASDSHVH